MLSLRQLLNIIWKCWSTCSRKSFDNTIWRDAFICYRRHKLSFKSPFDSNKKKKYYKHTHTPAHVRSMSARCKESWEFLRRGNFPSCLGMCSTRAVRGSLHYCYCNHHHLHYDHLPKATTPDTTSLTIHPHHSPLPSLDLHTTITTTPVTILTIIWSHTTSRSIHSNRRVRVKK